MATESEQEIIFFIDRCLGKKQVAKAFQSSGIAVEIHDDHFGQNAQDVDWLPEIGKRGWVVLTKDAKRAQKSSRKNGSHQCWHFYVYLSLSKPLRETNGRYLSGGSY